MYVKGYKIVYTRKWFWGRKCNGIALYASLLFLFLSLTVLSSLC